MHNLQKTRQRRTIPDGKPTSELRSLFDASPDTLEKAQGLGLDPQCASDLAREDLNLLREFVEAIRVLLRGVEVHGNSLGKAHIVMSDSLESRITHLEKLSDHQLLLFQRDISRVP